MGKESYSSALLMSSSWVMKMETSFKQITQIIVCIQAKKSIWGAQLAYAWIVPFLTPFSLCTNNTRKNAENLEIYPVHSNSVSIIMVEYMMHT